MEKETNKASDETAGQPNSSDEKKTASQVDETTQKKEGEGEGQYEKITLSKEEFEKLTKKATDFDGIIEKQRLKKLAEKEQSQKKEDNGEEKKSETVTLTKEEIEKMVEEKASAILSDNKKGSYEENLKGAYNEFIKDHKWADTDEIITSISKNFEGNVNFTKEQILSGLEIAAAKAYPQEYKNSLENKIKSKLLAEESNINAGDGGTGVSTKKDFSGGILTPEQIRMAERCGNKPDEVYKK